MAVLDGKYEILSQQPVAEGQMQFDAVAPDGAALRIIWYELDNQAETEQFERYRRLLRRLRKGGFAALHDVVSRPGAHYIAWYVPETAQWGKPSADLLELLATHAYRAELADIRKTKEGKAVVYDLAFDPAEPFTPVLAAAGSPTPDDLGTTGQQSHRWYRRPRSPVALAWSLSAILMGLSAIFFLASLRSAANTGFVTVPDLVGLNVNDASRRLKALNLKVATSAAPSTEALGTVLSISPEAGTALKRYYPLVRLSYAVPANQLALAAVPNLSGMVIAEAETALSKAGLKLGKTAYTTSRQPIGTVISQSRTATTQISEGSVVDILLSEGQAEALTFAPDLVGMKLEDAQFLLGIAGLKFEIDTLNAPGYAPGTVVEQTIAPYEPVDLERAVMRLYVNESQLGELAGAVTPSFIGLSEVEAGRLARTYTLSILEVDTPDLPGGVVNQTPAPGSPLGRTLELTFNVYTPPVAIPVPRVSVDIREPEERTLDYAWNIESGIRESFYTVRVNTAQGDSYVVQQGVTAGGETVKGSLTAQLVGPVEFELFLQNQPYSVPLRRN